MTTQRYSVTQHPIDTLLAWIKSGEIAIPEIQRPFVWDATKVRNLLDSLYQGYPIGYLIAWRNPTVRLKDGSSSAGKRILIDGQQRVTALMAALLGREVLTEDYETVRISIAFHPVEEKFEVSNPAIRKDSTWIHDVAAVFSPEASITELTDEYEALNEGADRRRISRVLEKLRKIINNHVGIIELDQELEIETVTEIFIRVNSAGARLNQADFAMSKIASNETYGGNQLRKAIDYFCHCAKSPEHLAIIAKGDKDFASSDYFKAIRWLKNATDDLYMPSYTDMLRVAFNSQFPRGRLQDLVALLSGRNFETKQNEERIVEESFGTLKKGVLAFVNQTNFERFVMIIKSAGFVSSSLLGSQNNVNFAYILYLRGRASKMNSADLEQLVRRWYVFSLLTRRYSRATPETEIDYDLRQMDAIGVKKYCTTEMRVNLNPDFWNTLLPYELDTSSPTSAFFLAFIAAQIKAGDKGFLSRDIKVEDLWINHGDIHHVYPKDYLKKQGLSRGEYNQIANFVVAQSEINIAIGNQPPEKYFIELAKQCRNGKKKFGGITRLPELKANLKKHCLPLSLLTGKVPDYETFLMERRQLMAAKLRKWFEEL